MKAISYIRISEEDENLIKHELRKKLEDQDYHNKKFISENGWKYLKTYNEGFEKSTDRNRKVFTEMKLDAMNKLFDVIVVREQSRLARDSPFLLDFLKDMKALGIKVYESSTGRELNETILETKVRSMFIDEARIEEGKKAFFLMTVRKKDSKLPFGKAPFGYVNDKKTKNWIVNEEKAKIVKVIFEKYVKFKNINKVVKYVNGKYNVNFNKVKVWRILKNKAYCGIFSYKIKRKGANKIMGYDTIEYEANYEKIISKSLFEKVQRFLGK